MCLPYVMKQLVKRSSLVKLTNEILMCFSIKSCLIIRLSTKTQNVRTDFQLKVYITVDIPCFRYK